MADFQFQEDQEWSKYAQQGSSYWNEAEQMPILVRLIMKTGVSRRASYYVLFGTLIICTFITYQVIARTFFPQNYTQPTYIEDIPPEVRATLPPEVLKQLPSRNAK